MLNNQLLLRGLSVVFLILFFLGNSVRVLFSPQYLNLVYNISYIPRDEFGFTKQDRIEKATKIVTSLVTNQSVDSLVDEGVALNNREITHLDDVKKTVQIVNMLHIAVALILSLLIYFHKEQGPLTLFYLTDMSYLKLISVFAFITVTLILLFWNTFFTTFHKLLFEDGTWMFYADDTLIRLFPEEFWIVSTICLLILIFIQVMIMRFFLISLNQRRTPHQSAER